MNIDEKTLSEIIAQIVDKTVGTEGCCACESIKKEVDEFGTKKEKDPSGIIKLNFDDTKLDRFQEDGVTLNDLVTLDEAPRIGLGLMEINHSKLDWTLTYDEYDYVIEGELCIDVDGRTLKARSGEMIYIPKNTHINFRSDSWARYVYMVYPADWANQ